MGLWELYNIYTCSFYCLIMDVRNMNREVLDSYTGIVVLNGN
jgi:hypothetical protein